MEYKDDNINKEERMRRHKRTKLALKILGPTLMAIGITMAVIGFMNAGNFENHLFFLAMGGLPLTVFGIFITVIGFHSEVQRYVIDEAKENTVHMNNYMISGTREEMLKTMNGVGEAISKNEIRCPSCGALIDSDSKFCKSCGKPLVKICRYCGCENDFDSKFCKDCGKNIS